MRCFQSGIVSHRLVCNQLAGGRELTRWFSLLVAAIGFLIVAPKLAAGTWTPLNHAAPDGIITMLLLPDGTVMAEGGDGITIENFWYRLTPDSTGSYVNGTWSTLAAMHDTRLYFSSDVLTNGRVFVAGAEYGSGTNSAEVYDPVSNTWTMAPAPPAGQVMFYDSVSKILPNGNVLISPVNPATYGGTVIYNPGPNTFSAGPTLFRGYYQDEASWVKLPDNSILTIDPFGTNSERYIPSLNQWINDAIVPVPMYDPYGSELGAAFLLPDGRVFYLGATGNTVFYTPSGGTNLGSWQTGPVIPSSQATPDAPAAMMVNGKILCAVSPLPTSADHFPPPTSFYEFDPVANAFTQVNGPTGSTYAPSPYIMRMLDLPDGTVLLSASGSQLYVYQSGGTPLAAGKPAITGLTTNANGSYHLTGTLFNGICEGAAYGDDAQMDSNYPLIRMTNSANGNVYYARTVNWSSTGVMTGSAPESTDFNLPANAPQGTYSLVVVANGNSSDPVQFVYVPDALLVTPATGFAASGSPGGPFNLTSQSFSLTNFEGPLLNWSVINTSLWLTVSPVSGTLVTGGPAATVTASLNSAASNLVVGAYAATVVFSNLNTHYTQSRQFTLAVSPIELVQNGGFEAGSFVSWTTSGNFQYSTVTSSSSYVHSGVYGAQLGPSGTLGYLSQTIPTTPDAVYLLSFWLTNPTAGTPNQFLASWNGANVYNQSNLGAFAWMNLQYFVTAASSSTVLQFGFRNDPNYFGLDDISVTAVPPVIFQSMTKSNNTVAFSWSAMSGLVYQMQYKTNLTQASWVNLGSAITASNSVVTATDSPGTDPQRFYRLLVLP